MTSRDQWLVWPRRAGQDSSTTLIIMPHAGAGAAAFVPWAQWADPRIRVGIVRLPGRESRWAEPALQNMEEVVHGLTEAVHASVFGSVALFGHCSGATIAFELAHRLSLDGPARPSLLFPSSATPPHQSWQGDRLSRLADNELVAALRRLGGTPEAVLTNSELLELVLPAVRADFAIQESYVYRPSPPLANPIQAICGARDQSTGPSADSHP